MLRRLGEWAEGFYWFLAVSVFMGAYIEIPMKLSGTALQPGDQNFVATVCQACIIAGLGVFCSLRWRKVLFVARCSGLVNLFVLVAICSITWSASPDITFRRLVTLSEAVLFGYYAVASFPMVQIVKMIARTALVSVVASALLALAMPRLGVMTDALAGAWSGVYFHKNLLGWVTILVVLGYGWLAVIEPQRRLRYSFYVLIAIGVAVMSHSRTAQLAIVVMPIIGLCVRSLRLPGLTRLWVMYLVIVGALIAATLMAVFFTDIMLALGKDPTLTGRVPLWLALLTLIGRHLVLGYGYGAFFVASNPDLQWVVQRTWAAPEAHDAYIELMLQLGVPGLLLALGIMGGGIKRAYSGVIHSNIPWAGFAAVYLTSFAITNVVETILMHAGDIHCVLLPMVYAALRVEEVKRQRGLSAVDLKPVLPRAFADKLAQA